MELCKQTMIQSYNWTSFSPEKRGEADFNYYTQLLASDLAQLGENSGNYREKYIDKVMTIFHRQGRCASPMITGPANFNNRRNEKAWNSRDNAVTEFNHWREKYFKAINRERTLSPEEEIDKTLEELERLETRHELYKRMNKIKHVEEKRFFAESNDFMDVFNYWKEQGHIIPSFHLTNNNNKIKERRKKLNIMRSRVERKKAFQKIEFNGGFIDIENDRVIIKHHEKPSREIIEVIKSNGFRYSPKTVSWVRKHTENAVLTAKNIIPQLSINI